MVKEYRVSDFKESARRKGTIIHSQYRRPYKSWNHHYLMHMLETVIEGKVFSRMMENIRVIGVPDDYETDGKNVSIVEVCTTTAPTIQTVKAQTITKKTLQLQTYVWVMTPILIKLGYKVASIHWLEIYEQETREQLDRIAVTQREDIEDVIRARIISRGKAGKLGN